MKLIILLFPIFSFADQVQINCTNNQCNSGDLSTAHATCSGIVNKTQCEAKVLGNLCYWIDEANPNGGHCTALPSNKVCSGFDCENGQLLSIIKFRGILDKDINVLSNANGTPQNLGISFNAGAYPGKNANLALSAQNQGANAANLILIGDNIDNLNVNLDGYSGKRGKSSSEICAQKIKDGVYGTDLQTYFNNRRATTSADPDRCDADDLNYMQTFNFTCDDSAFTEVSTNDPTVQVSQVKKMARCSAVASYSHCVKRKVNVQCNFRLWSSYRQEWLNSNTLDKNSYITGPTSCVDEYRPCGSVKHTCTYQYNYITGTYGYVPGQVQVNGTSTSGIPYASCTYRAGGVPTTCPNNTQQIYEGYQKVQVCSGGKYSSMPSERSLLINSIDEDFYNNEVNRLGGIAKFCDSYASKPPKSNQDWWGGATGSPSNAIGTVGGQAGKELNGIPWEKMSTIYGYNAPEPAGAIPNWKADAQVNGGFTPTTLRENQTIYNNCNSSNNSYCQRYTYYSHWFTKSSYWKGHSSSTASFTTPGLNPDGLTVAPGSNWQTLQTNTFEACPTGWTVLKNVFMNLVQYTNKENTSCSGVSDPQDPNNRAFWQYTGITQETTFGTEQVSCNIGSCAVESTVSELPRSLDTITPGSGENGTEQGRGLLFIYDVKNAMTNSFPGGSGETGLADISVNPQQRICVKIDDANAGINTPQAKNPFVSFRRYNWQVLRSVPGGNPGTPPRNTGKSVEVFKKIDPSARYLLDKSLL